MILEEAKRLSDLGLAVHWIRPGSKAPTIKGWSQKWLTWKELEATYRDGYGVGCRMGTPTGPSTLGPFTANLDVDVKSSEKRHRAEALAELGRLFPGAYQVAPLIATGYGLRLFVQTRDLLKSKKLAESGERVLVFMPGSDEQDEEDGLTSDLIKAGWRKRPAWQLELMSEGRQVVLPPSVHPDTGKHYTWKRPLGKIADLPIIDLPENLTTETSQHAATAKSGVAHKFTVVKVDLVGSQLNDYNVDMILTGASFPKAGGRSEAVYSLIKAMVAAGFADDEILTVCTDSTTKVGQVAYEHRKTRKRDAAAAWIWPQIAKARAQVAPETVFAVPAEPAPTVSAEVAEERLAKIRDGGGAEEGWQNKIKRNKQGAPLATLYNTLLVLEKGVGTDVFRHNLFSYRHIYGRTAPWTDGTINKSVHDLDIPNIKAWLSHNYGGLEPPKTTIEDAVTVIATANSFHPVVAELESLPPWDGVPRLNTWLVNHFGAQGDPDYLAQVLRKWMVASVTRTYRPGAYVSWMPILQGEQGTGKSTFGSILYGAQYTSDWLPALHEKDAALGLQGIRCHEFSELDSLGKNQIETTKAFLTRVTDKIRPPFGKYYVDMPRGCVFFGTTNKSGYLKDETGNRRFMPVVVGYLDFKVLEREREQMWAEALHIYKNGLERTLEIEGDAVEHAKAAQAEKMIEDDSAFYIDRFNVFANREASKPEEERFDLSRFKIASLFFDTGPFAGLRQNLHHAAKALRECGYEAYTAKGQKWWRPGAENTIQEG